MTITPDAQAHWQRLRKDIRSNLAVAALPVSVISTNQRDVDWIGTVQELSSTGGGKGVLTLEIADGITVGTTNNQLSDSLGIHTLLDPGSAVYASAVSLTVGQTVRFRGKFARSTDDCFQVSRLTQEGAMTEPDYLMAFSSVQGE